MQKKTLHVDPADPTFKAWAHSAKPGERIRWLLEVRQMKQTELAEKMEISQAAISNWITGESRKPNSLSLVRLADAIGSNEPWIMYGKGSPLNPSSPSTATPTRQVPKASTALSQGVSRPGSAGNRRSANQSKVEASSSVNANRLPDHHALVDSGDLSDAAGILVRDQQDRLSTQKSIAEFQIVGGMERRLIEAYRVMPSDAKLALLAVADALACR